MLVKNSVSISARLVRLYFLFYSMYTFIPLVFGGEIEDAYIKQSRKSKTKFWNQAMVVQCRRLRQFNKVHMYWLGLR